MVPPVESGRGPSWMRVVPSAVVAMDTEGRITSLNPAAEVLLGTTEPDAAGRTYVEIFGPSLSDRMVNLFLRVARSGKPSAPQMMEATLPADGRRARLRAGAGPVLDGDGTFVGIMFVADEQVADAEADAATAAGAEREHKLREALRRYTGDAVAAAVDARPSFVDIGGRRQTITCMHGDVRGYTTVAEALEPEEVTTLLLRYHGVAVKALQREGATLDRFIGDAILAMWNAPVAQPEHTRMAIRGALALQEATREVGTELQYGAGVHTGPAVVGNLGSDQFMNYTAIGDTVNIAARLQSAAGTGEIVCSRATLDAAGPGLRVTPLGELTVKGRKATVEAYRVDGLDG